MKTTFSNESTRNRHFMEACRKVLSESAGLTAAMVAERAAALPAPCYYITYGYALRRLRALRKQGDPSAGNPKGARALWAELHLRVDALSRRHGISDSEALARVLAEGRASSFFLAPRSALRLYQAIRFRHRLYRLRP